MKLTQIVGTEGETKTQFLAYGIFIVFSTFLCYFTERLTLEEKE